MCESVLSFYVFELTQIVDVHKIPFPWLGINTPVSFF